MRYDLASSMNQAVRIVNRRSQDRGMSVKVGVVMDPIESIIVKKDTTLAMLLAAQKREWVIH